MSKERMYRAPTRGGDTMMTATEYVAWLRGCANLWRNEATTSTNAEGCMDQAAFCERLAEDIESGKVCTKQANLINCNDHPYKPVSVGLRCEWRFGTGAFHAIRECSNDATVRNAKNGRRYCANHGKRLKNPEPIVLATSAGVRS